MCNRNLYRILWKYNFAFFGFTSGRSVECLTDYNKESRKKDRDSVCAFSAGSIYRDGVSIKHRPEYVKGSLTIEAALIVPIVIFTVLFILYTAFYMHNRAVIQEAAYETAIYGTTLNRKDTNNMKQNMQIKYQNSIEGRLISMGKPQIAMEVKDHNVIVQIQGAMMTVPIGFLPDYNSEDVWARKSVSFKNPVQIIRLKRAWDSLK